MYRIHRTGRKLVSALGFTSCLLPIAAGVSLGMVGSGKAYAQKVLEEVVVTARKRQESLQETPIAISAMSGDQLAKNGMQNVADLRDVVPNIDVYTGNGTTGAGNIFIRGVGARNTGVNYDSGVGIYLDGVYISRADGAVLDNVDIASLQVLRGPQGTLFGKNSTGGAILYATNKPSPNFEGNALVRAGNYNRLDGKLTVNVPLIDDLLLSRYSIYSTRREGYVENVTNGQKLNDEDRQGAQAHFLYLPKDGLIIDFNTFYAKTDQSARGQDCMVVTGIPGSGWQSSAQDATVIIPSTGESIAQHCQDNANLGIDKVLNDIADNRYYSENYTGALTVDWDINDNQSLKSITAFRTTRAGEANDLDGMGIPLLHRSNFGVGGKLRHTDQWSQEFQISGNAFDERLDYVAGIYGFKEKSDAGAANSPTGPFFGAIGVPTIAYYTNTLTTLTTDNWSYAAFSQVDWDITDTWTLTVGLRFTKEKRELRRVLDGIDTGNLTNDGSSIIPVFPGIYLFPTGAASFNPNHGFVHTVTPFGDIADVNDQTATVGKTKFTPMASLQHTLDNVGFIETGSVYFTVATGFLSGGIAEALDPFTQKLPTYKPEEVVNYELGFKMDALDRHLRVNAAAFYLDYKNRQLTSVVIDPATGRVSGIPVNAKKSSISGIEIESQYIPIDNFEISFNYTFNEGKIKQFDDTRIVIPGSLPGADCTPVTAGGLNVDTCKVDRSDENLPRLPTQVFFVGLQYTFQTAFGNIVPRVTWSLREDVDNCFDRSSCLSGVYRQDQEDVGARLTWTSPQKAWTVAAYGTNLTHQRYIIGGTPLVDVTQTAGIVYNDPSMYGVELSYNW